MAKKILAMLMVLALTMAMGVAAFADDNDYVEPRRVNINQGDRTLEKGRSMTLSYTITPRDTDYNDDVSWSSSDSDVVEVDQSGYIYAAGAGKATITVRTGNNKSDSIEITVPGLASGVDYGTESSSSSSSTASASAASSRAVPSATTAASAKGKISRDDLIKEVRGAGGKTVKLQNYTSVSAATLRAAANESKSKLQFDTMNGKSVTGRILINPALAAELKGDIKLGVYTTSAQTKTVQAAIDRQYSRNTKVIYCEQADYGMDVTLTANVGNMNSNNLKVYTCDKNGKNVKELKVTGLKIDSKGFVKFKTSTGGYLIVADGTLK